MSLASETDTTTTKTVEVETKEEEEDIASSIKTMKLYNDIERIENELQSLGISSQDSLDATQLSQFDSMHYCGNEAVQHALEYLSSSSKQRRSNDDDDDDEKLVVLDIGSGFGGPARYMASHSPYHVVALELQEDIHTKAMEWTQRCGLSKQISHVCGDILKGQHDEGSFDGIVSWLTFLHIPDKQELFKVCHQLLKKKKNTTTGDGSSTTPGHLFVEDYYKKASPFTHEELESLQNDVYCQSLPSQDEYVQALSSNGFTDIVFTDVTDEWTSFVQTRYDLFVSHKDRFTNLHGEATYDKLHHFYKAVKILFEGGHLGGVRVSASAN
mmetsp:Transcript_24306/g.37453  ORF Transcript_24306/g.37453 Transcript_24306/m.37453 type:complete len:327 (-) Transcript_24306:434-1414(-)